MSKDKKTTEDEESLEEIVEESSEDDKEDEEIVEEVPRIDFSNEGIARQLARSLPQATTRIVESSDVEQESTAHDLETFVRSESDFDGDKKGPGNDFYSGKNEEGEEVYVGNEPKVPVEVVAGSYEASHAAGEVYEAGSQDFRDPKLKDNSRRLGEVEALDYPSVDVPGATKKKDVKYVTKTFQNP